MGTDKCAALSQRSRYHDAGDSCSHRRLEPRSESSTAKTAAPQSARARAVAAPMPWLLPVTRRLIPFYNEQRHLMLSLISFERETSLRVLDLGCAPGLLAVDLLAAFPRVTLTVFDLTAEMIEACRDSLRENERVTYRVGDFRIDDLGNGHDLILASGIRSTWQKTIRQRSQRC